MMLAVGLFVYSAQAPSIVPPPAIPKSLEVEHQDIHTRLVDATKASGPVGVAAKALAEVLHPHFVREEQIALPPLGLLAPLAARHPIDEGVARAMIEMTATLEKEMPAMLTEHRQIRAAVARLRAAAVETGLSAHVQLADDLALHAQSEEEVLYPAAILVGDLLRRVGESRVDQFR
jgi:iron-sulfur cluster repair protein YtfE (RIC family)